MTGDFYDNWLMSGVYGAQTGFSFPENFTGSQVYSSLAEGINEFSGNHGRLDVYMEKWYFLFLKEYCFQGKGFSDKIFWLS